MTLASHLNVPYLAKLVRAKRGSRGLRETAESIGDVSPATLSRIASERINDMTMSTFLRVCDWLEIDPSEVLVVSVTAPAPSLSEGDELELQIRQSQELSPQTAGLLAAVVRAVYCEERRQRES